MVNFLDGVVGNLTATLKAKGMWDNTIMLFMSDNGGPIYGAGSNYPLRGGKYSEFEGGVRVAAFASGGLLPKSIRGTAHGGLGSVADVYTTLCGLAGVDSQDIFAENAGLPAVDGVDLSEMLLSAKASPREELPLSPLKPADLKKWDKYDAYINGSTKKPVPVPITGTQAGIIVGDLKLVTGTAINMAAYVGPFFPNASTPWIKKGKVPEFDCSTRDKIGCLFNVSADPTEHNDLALSHPKDTKRLLDRLRAWSATRFDPMRGDTDPRACPQVEKNGGFYGPFAP
jgi:arylsulfatase I/J